MARKSKKKKKKKKLKARNPFALAALMRNSAGPMKHKLVPKKGAKNKQQDYKDENH